MKEGVPHKREKVRAKGSKEIQAQIASFAAEGISDWRDSKHVFENIVGLAESGTKDAVRVLGEHEYTWSESANSTGLEKGDERAVAYKDYLTFLRDRKGTLYEGVTGRYELLDAYPRFASKIEELKKTLESTKPKEHEAFLGNGSNASVFYIESDGKRYAVRIPSTEEISPTSIDHHLSAAFLSKGIPHLEQIVAASYEDGVTVAEIMPGKHMGQLTLADVEAISSEQLGELINTLSRAIEKGIIIDPKPSNIFYDSKEGFGIVDLTSAKAARFGKESSLGTVTGWMTVSFLNTGTYGHRNDELTTVEAHSDALKMAEALLHKLELFKIQVEEKLSSDDKLEALREVQKGIDTIEDNITKLKDPNWVKENIEREIEWSKRKTSVTKFKDWGGVEL